MIGANRATILRQDQHYLQIDRNELPLDPRHLVVRRVCAKRFMSLWFVWHKPCTYLALTLTLSLN
jgi:hypothetical protein